MKSLAEDGWTAEKVSESGHRFGGLIQYCVERVPSLLGHPQLPLLTDDFPGLLDQKWHGKFRHGTARNCRSLLDVLLLVSGEAQLKTFAFGSSSHWINVRQYSVHF